MKKLLSLIIVLAAFCACQTSGDPVDLVFNLEMGQTYVQSFSSEMDIEQTMFGQKMNTKMTMVGTVDYTVTGKTGDVYDMEVKYSRMAMGMEMPFMNITMDSADPDEDNLLSQMMSGIIGKSFNVKMNNKGKVLEMEGLEEMFDGIYDDFPFIGEEEREEAINQLKESFGDNMFKDNFERGTAIFPDHPVKKGDKWVMSATVKSAVSMDIETTYEYKGMKNGRHLINGVSTISPEGGSMGMEMGMEFEMEMKGKITCKFELDEQTCWTVDAKMDMDLDAKAVMEASEQMPTGMTMDMHIKGIITFTGE